jgi:hypothetical protein
MAKYVRPRVPVILEGEMDDWPARTKWTHEFFSTHYGDSEVNVRLFDPNNDQQGSTQTMKLGDYIASFHRPNWPDRRRPPYLSDWSCIESHPEILNDFRTPACFPNWVERLPLSILRKLPYAFVLIGPAGAVYNLHVDFYGSHAWIAQFVGRKRFVLYPPSEGANLCNGRVDPDAPDYQKFPNFRNARGRMEATLEPGQIVFIPAGWWHQVTSLDDSLSLVSNLVNGSNVGRALKYCALHKRTVVKHGLHVLGVKQRKYYL